MRRKKGGAAGDYRAPLFLAWQLTNRCSARCLHCCEESGPELAWPDELGRERALSLAGEIAGLGIPYAAFGGGEPLCVPHVWEIFAVLRAGGVEIKIETDGSLIDDAAAARLKALNVSCIQLSLDGASGATHERVRPGGKFSGALGAVRRLAALGLAPEVVFTPTRLNAADAPAVYELAAAAGARTFVTGPLMRLGRAARSWDELSLSPGGWKKTVAALRARAAARQNKVRLAVYPWDIQAEIKARAASPQAMALVAPSGKVKLLNALPFAAADLKKQTLASAWPAAVRAWKSPRVLEFAARACVDPALLAHANECWDV